MAAAFLIVTLGGIMVYSALTGTSITDLVSGVANTKLDPKGGATSSADLGSLTPQDPALTGTETLGGPAVDSITGSTTARNTYGFKGPRAALLTQLANTAVNRFHLKITSTSGGNHVPDSLHYVHRAFDCGGSEADMRAFAQYVFSQRSQILELIHNPGPCVKNGNSVNGAIVYAAVWTGHKDHVHVGA